MKKKEPAGEGRNRKRKILPLTAGILTAALVITAVQIPGVAAKAAPIKLESGSCSLTVQPCFDEKSLEDLLGSNKDDNEVAIDLYKVADAVKAAGYDSYDFEVADAYSSLAGSLTQEALSDEGMNNDQWLALAKQVAEIALNGQQEKINPEQQYMAAEKIENLDPGLYLMVAKDAKPETGKKIFEAENAGSEEDSGTASKIYTERYVYTFEPQLVAIPGKPVYDENGGIVSNNTANGEWTYDMETTLKPVQEERFGDLKITKSLQSYETQEPAQFVFQVNATRDGEIVYSDVVSVVFDQAGQQEVTLMDKIPVDAEVEVKEVYSGAAYTVSGSDTANGRLTSADDMLETEFTNTYHEDHRGGHGILNSFTYSETDGWQWDQTPSEQD